MPDPSPAVPPGLTTYGGTLKGLSPETWGSAYCPSGEFHRWVNRFLRRRFCGECGYPRQNEQRGASDA